MKVYRATQSLAAKHAFLQDCLTTKNNSICHFANAQKGHVFKLK